MVCGLLLAGRNGLLRSLLFHTSSLDPLTYACACGAMRSCRAGQLSPLAPDCAVNPWMAAPVERSINFAQDAPLSHGAFSFWIGIYIRQAACTSRARSKPPSISRRRISIGVTIVSFCTLLRLRFFF